MKTVLKEKVTGLEEDLTTKTQTITTISLDLQTKTKESEEKQKAIESLK